MSSNALKSGTTAASLSPVALAAANLSTGTKGLLAVDKVGNSLLWFDPVTFEKLGQLAVAHPHQMILSPDHSLAYVSEFGVIKGGRNVDPGHFINVVDVEKQCSAARIDLGEDAGPHGLRWDANGQLWVICEETGYLVCIDAEEGRPIARLQVAAPKERAHLIEMTPDGSHLFVSCKFGPLKVVDMKKQLVIATVDVGPGTEGIAVMPDGDRILVAENGEQSLIVIDAASHLIIDRVLLRGAVMSSPKRSRLITLQMAPQAGCLLSSNGVSAVVHIHPLQDLHSQEMVVVAKGPQGMAVTQDGARAVIANHDAGVATLIDLSGPRAGKATGWFEAGAGVEALTFFNESRPC